MPEKADYYTRLADAVARLGYDSFEARGAIYDRARSDLLKRLSSTEPPLTNEEIAREQAALFEAIRDIEFGGMVASSRHDKPGISAPQVTAKNAKPDLSTKQMPRRRMRSPVSRRIAGRMLLALLVLIAVVVTLAFHSEELELRSFTAWLSKSLPLSQTEPRSGAPAAEPGAPTQRAVLYEEDAANPAGKTFVGSASWRIRSERSEANTKAENIAVLELEIWQLELALTMTMRRDAEKGAISHLIEFKFFPSKLMPPDTVASVLGLLMKKDELVRGVELRGQVVKVAPGMFLLGLSGQETDVQQNSAAA